MDRSRLHTVGCSTWICNTFQNLFSLLSPVTRLQNADRSSHVIHPLQSIPKTCQFLHTRSEKPWQWQKTILARKLWMMAGRNAEQKHVFRHIYRDFPSLHLSWKINTRKLFLKVYNRGYLHLMHWSVGLRERFIRDLWGVCCSSCANLRVGFVSCSAVLGQAPLPGHRAGCGHAGCAGCDGGGCTRQPVWACLCRPHVPKLLNISRCCAVILPSSHLLPDLSAILHGWT